MKLMIKTPEDLGLAIRATRKANGIRQDDHAGFVGVSTRFASEVEHGKPTAQIGKVLELIDSLGLTLTLDVPAEAMPMLEELRGRYVAQAGRHQRRSKRGSKTDGGGAE